MSRRPKYTNKKIYRKPRYIDTNFFKIRHGTESLTCQMRILYNITDGAVILIHKKGEPWTVHSVPFPAPLPKTEVERLFGLFRASVLKCDKRAKFVLYEGVPKNA